MNAGWIWQPKPNGLAWLLLLTLWGCAGPLASQESPISATECAKDPAIPVDYRETNYRSPTPRCTPYGTTLTPPQLHRLLQQQSTASVALIDVLGVTRRPEMDEFDSAWLPSRTRYNLQGSHWLPNVGYARLDAEMMSYFVSNLQRITENDKRRAIVMYCIVDCWLSWNAIKRAHELGYSALYWFPDGTDGWADFGYHLAPSTPIPIYQDTP